ncbi:MAG TPA: hypothetical protein VEB86_08805, partial [Chryseosolibacter sp.]|nr:hypothetical protein [Chryseosolibacter sp.]
VALIRGQLVRWISAMAYDAYIFADTDDVMSNERVEVCGSYLKEYPIVVNDIAPFASEDRMPLSGYWGDRLRDRHTFNRNGLLGYNVVGLGNAAVRRAVLHDIVIPNDLIAVDWFLFFHWMDECEAVFTRAGKVFYRQHDANMIGARQVTPERLRHIARVKSQHYRALVCDFPFLGERLERHEDLIKKFTTDAGYVARASEYLKAKQINYFWWEETEYIHE